MYMFMDLVYIICDGLFVYGCVLHFMDVVYSFLDMFYEFVDLVHITHECGLHCCGLGLYVNGCGCFFV